MLALPAGLAGAVIEGGSMKASTLFPVVLAVLPVLASAQDILHYKFESGGGATEINFGSGDPGIPQLAQIVAAPGLLPSQGWAPGKFGTALAAGLAGPAQ